MNENKLTLEWTEKPIERRKQHEEYLYKTESELVVVEERRKSICEKKETVKLRKAKIRWRWVGEVNKTSPKVNWLVI